MGSGAALPLPHPQVCPDPSLTCTRCSNNFGLAAGTIPLGGIGSDSNGVGGLWGQAADSGFLREEEGSVPITRMQGEARPCQGPQDPSLREAPGHARPRVVEGGAVQRWPLLEGKQVRRMQAWEDPAHPKSRRLGQTAHHCFQTRTKGQTVSLTSLCCERRLRM